jgi:uncharacterized protein
VIVWIGTSIGNESLERFTNDAFTAWGIGRKGHDDGVAIFILTQDRKARIEVGYGLEGQLTDLVAGQIIRERLAPGLRAGNGDAAVTATVDGVLSALGGEAAGADEAPPGQPVSKWRLVGMGIFGIFFLLFLVTHPRAAMWLLFTMASSGRRGGGWSGGGGGGYSGGGGRSGGGGASGSW